MKVLVILAFIWFSGETPLNFSVSKQADPVVEVAVEMMSRDLEEVTGTCPEKTSRNKSALRIIQYDKERTDLLRLGVPAEIADSLDFVKEAFYIGTHGKQIIVAGSDARGTAYGVLEISRLAGVSPWTWWGDSRPTKRSRLELPDGYSTFQHPSVEYRGIFINDEDWAFRPWSTQTFSPQDNPETISADTYREIFKLLLRLRANTLWPAMHPGTTPFFMVPGAREAADSCGIFIGTSHCEPLLRSNTGEWDVKVRGRYNYITNKQAVLDYWKQRLEQTKGFAGLYTIGMRGIHDGSMEGVSTLEEKTTALQQVIYDQRDLLREFVNPDITKVPQMFMPYKEVLQIMENGLEVPEDVTIVWCDDNYGYMTRLSDSLQQKRSGGAGVYYHLSYCGRPHDYLWLCTTQPGLIYHEMSEAWKHNVRKLWIANVHDPKVAAYDMEFFLDMAWNVNFLEASEINSHLEAWLEREFGGEVSSRISGAMEEYYRLCAMRKPEFMGWSQVELPDRERYPSGLSKPKDTEFSFSEFGNEAQRYIGRFRLVAACVKEAEALVPERARDAYFASVTYPVCSAALMAEKMLYAQLARSRAKTTYTPGIWKTDTLMMAACALSKDAYLEIRKLTGKFNSMADGRWKGLMSEMPRSLYVFWAPELPVDLDDDERALWRRFAPVAENKAHGNGQPGNNVTLQAGGCISGNASEFVSSTFEAKPVQNLGHSGNAVPIPKGEGLEYAFESKGSGKAVIRIAVIPTQAMDNGDIRFSVSLDGGQPSTISIKEPYRSEQWKVNVMRQQALVEIPVDIAAGNHNISLYAVDDHIVLDQWMVDFRPDRRFYLFPHSL